MNFCQEPWLLYSLNWGRACLSWISRCELGKWGDPFVYFLPYIMSLFLTFLYLGLSGTFPAVALRLWVWGAKFHVFRWNALVITLYGGHMSSAGLTLMLAGFLHCAWIRAHFCTLYRLEASDYVAPALRNFAPSWWSIRINYWKFLKVWDVTFPLSFTYSAISWHADVYFLLWPMTQHWTCLSACSGFLSVAPGPTWSPNSHQASFPLETHKEAMSCLGS